MPRYYLQTEPGLLGVLIRHGSTKDNNGAGLIRGWKDEQLSPAGRLEVEFAARRLKQYNLQFLYCSDFMRDTETKFILANRLGISGLETNHDARTWDTGFFSGKPESEVTPAIREIYKQPWESAPGGSESFNDFIARWTGFLDSKLELAAQVETFRPLGIITHGRNIALAESYITGRTMWECDMPYPAGFALISIGEDRALNIDICDPKEGVLEDK